MGVAEGVVLQSEEISEVREREVTRHVLFLVHDTRTQGFLVRLTLEDFLLDGAGLRTQN